MHAKTHPFIARRRFNHPHAPNIRSLDGGCVVQVQIFLQRSSDMMTRYSGRLKNKAPTNDTVDLRRGSAVPALTLNVWLRATEVGRVGYFCRPLAASQPSSSEGGGVLQSPLHPPRLPQLPTVVRRTPLGEPTVMSYGRPYRTLEGRTEVKLGRRGREGHHTNRRESHLQRLCADQVGD